MQLDALSNLRKISRHSLSRSSERDGSSGSSRRRGAQKASSCILDRLYNRPYEVSLLP